MEYNDFKNMFLKILYSYLVLILLYSKYKCTVNTMRTAQQICDFPFKSMGTGCQISDF
jgi:hypothetical protein